MQYIEAIDYTDAKYMSIFLAGGISNCPNWQKEVADSLNEYDITVYNPRRKNFPIDIKEESEKQIKWEFDKIRKADIIVFWFSYATLNPITLFEYGAALERNQKIIVGIHPDYKRKIDVEIQTKLKQNDITIVYSIPKFIKVIEKHINNLIKS